MSQVFLRLVQFSSLVIGDRQWLWTSVGLVVFGGLLALWLNRRRLTIAPIGPVLRILGWTLLALCLLNPLWSSSRPRSRANVIAVVADISRSHLVAGDTETVSRAQAFQDKLKQGESKEPVGWLNRLSQDFELRRYTVADRLQQVDHFEPVEFNGTASDLHTALRQLKQRFEGQPLAGVILLTDGNATDSVEDLSDLSGMPPVYSVVPPNGLTLPDSATGTHSVTQTAFDDAPVTIQVQPEVANVTSGKIAVTLCDASGLPLETQTRAIDDPSPLKFKHRPTEGGAVFYQIKTALQDTAGKELEAEATLVNNSQLIAVQRSTSPRRILYVSGRPNWDFKFLRRAVETDPQLQIVALIRIAKKEAKFDFRGREGEQANSLFRGFDKADPDTVEEYDEPVLIRLGTKDDQELRGGFPQAAEDLFQYDAIVIDDVEAGFFLADQMKLIYDFVSRRGGGLLMMAGQESFRQGGFDRTPIGETLPIDVSRDMPFPKAGVRLSLTRDGWLQPWIRLRSDEVSEEERLLSMPEFITVNPAGFIRPGAVIMAEVKDEEETSWPALVVQRFGKGRTAALCVGDLWRWRLSEGLRQLQGLPTGSAALDPGEREPVEGGGLPTEDLSDHARACRQMMRWLVADVPRRQDVNVSDDPTLGSGSVRLTAFVRGADFEPRENADVKFQVTSPDGQKFEMTAEPSDTEPGVFESAISTTVAGAWKATATALVAEEATADRPASNEPLTASLGWAYQPDQKEMRSVAVNRTLLDEVSRITKGKTIELDELETLTASLPQSSAPLTEIWSWPIWHSWWVFATALACLVTDWTLRRRSGLP